MKTTAKLVTGAALSVTTALTWVVFSQKPETVRLGPVSSAAMEAPSFRAAAVESKQGAPPAAVPQTTGLTPEQAAALANLATLLEQENGTADAALAPLRAWAAQDPAAAAQWAVENLEGAARRRALTEVIALWAARSPQQALAWLDAQRTYEGNEEPYSAAFAALATGDAPAAAAWLQQHPDLASRENHEILLSHWTASDAPAASAWLRTSLSPAMQEALLPTVLAGLNDPHAAAAIVAAVQPQFPDAALNAASSAAGQAAPQYALDLAVQVSDEASRATLTENIQRGFAPPAAGMVEIAPPAPTEAAAPMPGE